jgi:hypothetical protein
LSFKPHIIDLKISELNKLLKTKIDGDTTLVWDPIRKSWLILQPEEWVRQIIILYLSHTLGISRLLIHVEKQISVNGILRRFDIIVYNKAIQPFLLIECKSPKVAISQSVFDQVAVYNHEVKAPYIVVSNAITTYCAKIDNENRLYEFLSYIPIVNN